MKVSELTGENLSTWVARAQGWITSEQCDPLDGCKIVWNGEDAPIIPVEDYRPDINWSQCGELIEKFDVEVSPFYSEQWTANKRLNLHGFMLVQQQGTTPQEAICRAVVASVYGEEVEEKA